MLQVFIFSSNVMLPDLVLQRWLLLLLLQLIDGVGDGADQVQALDLDPDGCQVGQVTPYCGELFWGPPYSAMFQTSNSRLTPFFLGRGNYFVSLE